jgi:hypothetical protein
MRALLIKIKKKDLPGQCLVFTPVFFKMEIFVRKKGSTSSFNPKINLFFPCLQLSIGPSIMGFSFYLGRKEL